MKLSVTQENLSKALNTIGRVAEAKNGLAILNNILFRVDGARLMIAATNMEIAATQYIGAKIEKSGSITIPARLVTEFVSSLPSGKIDLETKNDHLHISSGKFSSVINGVIADEFPELPTVNEDSSIHYEVAVDDFKKVVSQTVIAASSDVNRLILNGVYWNTNDGDLYLAATDGYRLAEKKLMRSSSELSAVIPTSTLQEVVRSLSDEDKHIDIFFDDTQVSFKTKNIDIVSKLIDGKFPDYRQLIPKNTETVVDINRGDFGRITKVASLFARDSGGGITLSASKDESQLSIHSVASELGENTSDASAEVTADGVVTLNSRYLVEVLNAVDSEDVTFSFSGKLSPCLLQEKVKDPDYLHIIMPMKS